MEALEKEEARNQFAESYRKKSNKAHTIRLQYTPSRRLAATIRGITVLGPKISPRSYRKIFWCGQEKRQRVVLSLFHRYLMQQESSRLWYGRESIDVWLDGHKVGFRRGFFPSKDWGSVPADALHLLFQDIYQVKMRRETR